MEAMDHLKFDVLPLKMVIFPFKMVIFPFKMVIYPLKMVIFHSFFYVYQRRSQGRLEKVRYPLLQQLLRDPGSRESAASAASAVPVPKDGW